VHPAKCTQTDAYPRMVMVASVHQSQTTSQCPANRRRAARQRSTLYAYVVELILMSLALLLLFSYSLLRCYVLLVSSGYVCSVSLFLLAHTSP